MRRILCSILAAGLATLPLAATEEDNKDKERLRNCGTAMEEILNVPDNIPQELLDKAECVVVLPSVIKAAFVFGGSWGRGAMVCRSGEHFTGPWGAPAMMRLEGGSVGLQIGGQATDFVLLIMNPRGANAILSSKVKLGADAAAAAGPKGREATAATDATMRAEVLTYSRSRGLFAGISLEGSTLRQDGVANRKVYGAPLTAREIIQKGEAKTPPEGAKLVSLLQKKSPKNLSDPKSLQ